MPRSPKPQLTGTLGLTGMPAPAKRLPAIALARDRQAKKLLAKRAMRTITLANGRTFRVKRPVQVDTAKALGHGDPNKINPTLMRHGQRNQLRAFLYNAAKEDAKKTPQQLTAEEKRGGKQTARQHAQDYLDYALIRRSNRVWEKEARTKARKERFDAAYRGRGPSHPAVFAKKKEIGAQMRRWLTKGTTKAVSDALKRVADAELEMVRREVGGKPEKPRTTKVTRPRSGFLH